MTRRLLLVALAVLSVTALSAAVAAAQESAQQAHSADLLLPTNTTGEFDTGTKQMNVYKSGQTDTNSSHQKLDPQQKQPRERGARGNKTDPVPTAEDPTTAEDPSGGDIANPNSNVAPAPASSPQPKAELPKSGGASSSSLFSLGAGTLLVAAGLLSRRLIKQFSRESSSYYLVQLEPRKGAGPSAGLRGAPPSLAASSIVHL